MLGADLYAVAQSHCFHAGVPLHVAGQHGHGVGVIQKPGIRADLSHVIGKVLKHRDGAQRAHDAADSKGVAYGLAQTVFFRDFKVSDGTGVVSPYLNSVDHKVGSPEGFLPVFCT